MSCTWCPRGWNIDLNELLLPLRAHGAVARMVRARLLDDGEECMQYGTGEIGRIFVLRLEEGDQLPDTVERFAAEHGVQRGLAFYVGGAADGSRLVVGPEENMEQGIVPMLHTLQGIHEVLAVGTLFPDETGAPVLHLHAAAGREEKTAVGCARAGVKVWLVGEVVLLEIAGIEGRREKERGFALLRFPSEQ
jgi:uncharacterized protein